MSAGIGTLWRFFAARAITFKKTAHAAEQDRADVVAAREAWFAGTSISTSPSGVYRRDRALDQDGPPVGAAPVASVCALVSRTAMCGRPLRCKKNLQDRCCV